MSSNFQNTEMTLLLSADSMLVLYQRMEIKTYQPITNKEVYLMPTEMEDENKGGEDRVKKLKEEQQKEIDKKDVEKPKDYPDPAGDTGKNVPKGT